MNTSELIERLRSSHCDTCDTRLLGQGYACSCPHGPAADALAAQDAEQEQMRAALREYITAWDESSDPKIIGSACRLIRAESALRDIDAARAEEKDA